MIRMEKYKMLNYFVSSSLIMINYDVEFEKIMSDFFKEESEEYVMGLVEEVKETLLELNNGEKIPMEKISYASNFSFDEEELKELCEDILEEHKKIN